jgi:DNA segregation ATPase FtsK/SpoIIIE-like protein
LRTIPHPPRHEAWRTPFSHREKGEDYVKYGKLPLTFKESGLGVRSKCSWRIYSVFCERQIKEIAGIFLLLISVILLLSLASFAVGDIKLLAEARPAQNIIGPLGVYFSEFLRGAFGYVSFITVVIFAISGWTLLKNGIMTDLAERIFSLIYLMFTASAMFCFMHESPIPHFSGGYLGQFFSKIITGTFGQIGAFIVLLVLNIVGLVLLGIISFSLIISDLKNRDTNILKIILGFVKKILKKLLLFNYDRAIPLTDFDGAIKNKDKKKPWITRKKIIIGGDDDSGQSIFGKQNVKLLELRGYKTEEKNSFADTSNEKGSLPLPIIEETEIISGDENDDTDFEHHSDNKSEIIFTDYIEEKDLFKIKTNRIKSAVIEHDVKPEVVIDGFENGSDDYEDEEDNEDEIKDTIIEKTNKNSTPETGDYEKPASYIPRVFEKIKLSEKYNIPTDYLLTSSPIDAASWKTEAKRNSDLLVKALSDFGIESRVINVHRGPVITLYEIQIAPGIKVNKIVGLSDDIAMALAAYKVRVVAPIPGKSAIGVEIPNTSREMVTIGDIVKSEEYHSQNMRLKVGLGKDIYGKPVLLDLKKQPHLLIAGATGAGKSICLNSIICDFIYNYDPNYLRFILIDPKMVELQLYNGLPHLLTPVITESYMAPKALKWATNEMERRYRLLSEVNARDLEKYNERIKGYEDKYESLPYIVIVIDELADLMMIAAKEIEGFITRIAQKARAVGIHLILATQRPSVDIITGIIKANFPARIAFQVAQKTDSRTILDQNGAETLLGKGDMLYQSPVSSFPVRIQGSFITEEEIMKIVRHTRKYCKPGFIEIDNGFGEDEEEDVDASADDALFVEAIKIIEETKKASASYLQRRLSIGYNRAARIIELAEERGYVGPQQGSKPREVYI